MQIELTPEYLASQGLSENFPRRFWAKVHKTETCWLWTACTNDDGYGFIGKSNTTETMSAHRASWILHNGPIPVGQVVRHQCRPTPNPACVNPRHLLLGTKKQNSNDAATLLREAGKPHWNARLTTEQVIAIRELCNRGISNVEVARLFGISPTHVSRIKHYSRLQNVAIDILDGSGWEI